MSDETTIPGTEQPTEKVTEKPTNCKPREHAEATCLAFTRVYDGDGTEWSLTLREGVTSEQLRRLLTAMQYTGKLAAEHGLTLTRPGMSAQPTGDKAQDQPPTKAPEKAGGVKTPPSQARPSGGRDLREYEKIARIVINPNAADPTQPRVELWSERAALKFPITTAPSRVLAAKLQYAYDLDNDAVAWLYDAGSQYKVNWAVKMVDSEKTNRTGKPYKDIGDLLDLDREG